jgi:tetratricopeptide (TPR) repeat protein
MAAESPPASEPQVAPWPPWLRRPAHWLRQHVQWLQFTVDGKALSRAPVVLAFGVMAVSLLVTLLPVRLDEYGLGSLTDGRGSAYVPALCFLAGDVCLAAGVWRAVSAARSRPLERVVMFGLGALVASLDGECLRNMLQVALLRDFYRPALFFSGPVRAAAVGWGLLLTFVLLAGFLAPAAVALANLIPAQLAAFIPPVRWLAARWSCLLWPFATLAIVVIVTQWVLPAPLAAAMGYRYLTPSGTVVTFSLRDLGPSAWASLQILFALPLVVLMWEGIESARTCQRLVRSHNGEETRLLRAVRRVDARAAAVFVILGCGVLAVIRHSVPAGIAAIVLLTVVSLSFTGRLGRAARLSTGFERGVRRWQLPEGWRDVGRFSLILVVLVAPAAGLLAGDIGNGAKSALWLPSDFSGFYMYWRDFKTIAVPSVTASGLYGHVDSVIWIACFVLAALLLFGMLIQGFRKDVRDGFTAVWFLLRVGAVAALLAPIARLADHSSATALLTGCAVIAVLLTFRRSAWPTAVWSVIIAGAALSLWSFVLWRLTWLPAAAMVGLTVIQRFGFNAGELNSASNYRPQRVAYFQCIALLSIAMLTLGHGAVAGTFDSEQVSAVSDRMSLSVIAIIWLIMLTVQQVRNAQGNKAAVSVAGGAAGNAGGPPEDVPEVRGQHESAHVKVQSAASSGAATENGTPASWSWLLDPELALVPFIGREKELATLSAWCEQADAASLRLVTGPGGIGKTRLALELCRRRPGPATRSVWVHPGQEAETIRALRPAAGQRTLLVVDNAETRPGLQAMIAQLAADWDGGMRVLLLARNTGEWFRALGVASPASWDLTAAAMRDRLVLAATVQPDMTDPQIVRHGVTAVARAFGLRESVVNTRRSKVHKRQNILELLAEALAATMDDAGLADTGTGTVPVDLRQRLNPLLSHEQEFWYERAEHSGVLGDGRGTTRDLLRHAIAASCLLEARSVQEAVALATRVVGIPSSAELTRWLDEICAASRSWTTADGFLHPGRLAELLTIRELTASESLRAACLTDMTSARAVRAVSFLARAFPDYTEATSLLNSLLPCLPDRIAGPHDQVRTLTEALGVLPGPNAALAPAAIALMLRLLGHLPGEVDPAQRAHWLEELSRWFGGAGDRAEAVLYAEEAVTIRREMTGLTDLRASRLPGLIISLENLAGCLKAQGEQAQALAAIEEAVVVARELAAGDAGTYGPWLARLLVSLTVDLGDGADPAKRIAAVAEAVLLYRQAAQTKPGLYEGALAFAQEVLSQRHLDAGHTDDAISVGAEALAIYQVLLTGNHEQYRPNRARALDNQGVFLARAGRQPEALAAAQEAVREYAKLQRSRPGQFTRGHAFALEHLSNRYRSAGQHSRAAAARQQAARLTAAKHG